MRGVRIQPSDDVLAPLWDAVLGISAERDVDAVLQQIAERGRALVGARYGALGVPNADGTHLARFYHSGMAPELVAVMGPFPTGRGVLGVMMKEGATVRVDVVSEHPRSVGLPPHHPPIDTLLGVAIVDKGTILGDLYVANKEDGSLFTLEDEQLLGLLCRPAALAIRNARLLERVTASEQAYRSLTEGAPDCVFALSADGTVMYANSAAHAVLGRTPEELVGTTLRALFSPHDQAVADLTFQAVGRGARHSSFTATVSGPGVSPRVVDVSVVPGGLDRQGYQGIARDVSAQRALAREIAERTNELLSTREERERLRGFVSLVIQAQEAERARIAGDLHDTTVQTLTAIGRRLRSLATQDGLPGNLGAELSALADAALMEAEEVRRLSRNLRPSVLDHLGLDAALQHLVNEAATGPTAVHLVIEGEAGPLDDLQRTTLFRIAQEALTNVRRHSGASEANVVLRMSHDEATLTVTDNGSGFPVALVEHGAAGRKSLGLAGMRERAGMMGGTLKVRSSGGGTVVEARLPLDR